ncbi:hypothetical protein C8J56DRAFT_64752 [Mycena floridula]|nr:hypothetical protein C8J56DRAFT_64752 [Mycena floridula]
MSTSYALSSSKSEHLDALTRLPACQNVYLQCNIAGLVLDVPEILRRLSQYLPELKTLVLDHGVYSKLSDLISSLDEAELPEFKHLGSFGLVVGAYSVNFATVLSSLDWCLHWPPLRQFLLQSADRKSQTRYRYMMVHGIAEPAIERCRLDGMPPS